MSVADAFALVQDWRPTFRGTQIMHIPYTVEEWNGLQTLDIPYIEDDRLLVAYFIREWTSALLGPHRFGFGMAMTIIGCQIRGGGIPKSERRAIFNLQFGHRKRYLTETLAGAISNLELLARAIGCEEPILLDAKGQSDSAKSDEGWMAHLSKISAAFTLAWETSRSERASMTDEDLWARLKEIHADLAEQLGEHREKVITAVRRMINQREHYLFILHETCDNQKVRTVWAQLIQILNGQVAKTEAQNFDKWSLARTGADTTLSEEVERWIQQVQRLALSDLGALATYCVGVAASLSRCNYKSREHVNLFLGRAGIGIQQCVGGDLVEERLVVSEAMHSILRTEFTTGGPCLQTLLIASIELIEHLYLASPQPVWQFIQNFRDFTHMLVFGYQGLRTLAMTEALCLIHNLTPKEFFDKVWLKGMGSSVSQILLFEYYHDKYHIPGWRWCRAINSQYEERMSDKHHAQMVYYLACMLESTQVDIVKGQVFPTLMKEHQEFLRLCAKKANQELMGMTQDDDRPGENCGQLAPTVTRYAREQMNLAQEYKVASAGEVKPDTYRRSRFV